MNEFEFNNKKAEMIELLRKAQMLADELSASEIGRQKDAQKHSYEYLDNGNEEAFKVACEVHQIALQNSSNLNATYNSIKNELERLEKVSWKY